MGENLDVRFTRPLAQMDQQAERMESLLKDLLWLSRIESVRSETKTEQVDVAAMLKELKEEISKGFPGRDIEVHCETDESLLGDFRELHSAASNLVINALKYSQPDGEVVVRWRREGDELLLSVQDEGVGIDPVHIPRLTERFYRVDDSRSSTTGGTGLGLAIVKHVAAAHGAELRIDSRLGEGSTFTLAFRRMVD
jgi:two-component system phosphate regulon sensor histidine kinase PhoR